MALPTTDVDLADHVEVQLADIMEHRPDITALPTDVTELVAQLVF